MNCLEFRRTLLGQPHRLDAEAAAHAAQCPACRAFYADALRLETRLEKALRVPAPRGFADRLFARLAPKRRTRSYALAAAVLLAAGLAATATLAPDDPLARAGIDFVVYEEARTIVEAKPVDAGIVGRVAREMRVSLGAQLGEVRYICRYPLAAGAAHHLLITTPLGKATLLLIPGRSLPSRGSASAKGLQAAVLAVPGGTAAIIADSARSLSRIEAVLKSI